VAHTDVLVRDLGPTGPGDGARSGTAGGGAERAAASLPPARVVVADAPDAAWVSTWLGVKGQADAGLARQLLGGSPALYLTAVEQGAPVGVLRAAFAEDWVGLSCLVVVPAARRRGLARRLTVAALAHAAERGARRAFLQVEVTNSAAARLYADLGFRPAERYHYRERALGVGPAGVPSTAR
jgi:ribosomal protein S18 acetylase RimI-like enzyme